LHHYGNLNFSIKEEVHSSLGRYIGRDEVETTDFFVRRLERAEEPFLGIYISFAAHYPYFDYGPEYRIMENDGQLVSRYYNNLYLLDRMIKRIYDTLREQGRLERTIFVVMGDHGQAFGQHHPDNYMHYRYSYGENLETPAILHQPALLGTKEVEFPTSHVDILPTLLDAMRIPHNHALLDGESLFQNRLKRRYLFFYGHEGSISSLGTDEIKVQYSLKKKKSWAYDLRRDPEEKSPLEGSSYPAQLEALHRFVSHHDAGLLQYNAQLREKNETPRTKTPVVLQVK
jgi:arylsulfatase A-like enzyme